MSTPLTTRHRCPGNGDCPICDRIAEDRADIGVDEPAMSDRAADRWERRYWGDSR